ncbi:MAG: hypothetical protein QOD75_1233 [Blastocatellia bacterium]|nr:hypothetical protein [Blastocatellia bacterium]
MPFLRIAFATPEYVTEEYFDGGLANHIHRVAKVLASMGHDIHVLTLSKIDETEFEHEGVTVHRIANSGWFQLDRLTRYGLPASIQLLNLSVKVYRKLKRLNSQQSLDVVQFPNYSCCGLASMMRLKVPRVVRASSYQPALNDALGIRKTVDSRVIEHLEALQFRLCHNIYTPSFMLQRMLAKEAGLSHVRVIRPPFYLETVDWDSSVYDRSLKGRKYLLFFGRFQLHKGVHTLVQALPRVFEQCPDLTVALVGRDMESNLAPSMAEYARAQCAAYADRLIVLDQLRHTQLYPVIAGAHLVVLPSLIDNFPNSCLEAMGLGKVVIGTAGTSFDELIDEGITGFLVPPNNSEALAEKINAAWVDPRLAEMGAAARQKTAEFSPEKTITPLLTYYREIWR